MSKRCLQGERPTSLSVLSEIVMKAHNQTRKIADIKIPDGYREQEFFPDLCLLKADREWDLETGFLRPISINRGSLVPKCLVHSQTFSNTNNGELLCHTERVVYSARKDELTRAPNDLRPASERIRRSYDIRHATTHR
ncbi:hypothetical protein AAG570_005603 [Ranatra chinensis]|uniref:Uncharacterized protein n=1 Tax=Ranatra chinensis TaxID=642074 RepID=A0ABD0XY90_9HEMI